MKSCFKSIPIGLSLRKMKGEEKGQHLKAPLVVMEEGGGTTMVEEQGTIHLQEDNHLPLRFQSSMERMTPTSTLCGVRPEKIK